jgi:hypothetical protein
MLMITNNKWQLEIGDWVNGKSKNGELIRGYIETVDPLQGTVKVNVVACDNEKTIGRTIETLNKWVEKLPISVTDNEEQILYLIDLALSTEDEHWFMELSAKLNSIRQGSKGNRKKNTGYPAFRNRLGKSGITE